MASRNPKFHGRVEGATSRCAVPGCRSPASLRRPSSPPISMGRARGSCCASTTCASITRGYNYFEGMSPDEITEAQGPLAGWERPSRKFAHSGADPAPAWSDFADPLEAIGARFRFADRGPPQRFNQGRAARARFARPWRRYRPALGPAALFAAGPPLPPRPQRRRPLQEKKLARRHRRLAAAQDVESLQLIISARARNRREPAPRWC